MATRDHASKRFVKLRWKMLAQFFDVMQQSLADGMSPSAEVKLDYCALFVSCQSYLDDIDRFKVWHLRSKGRKHRRANSVKHAAYLTYWLNKIRPVIVVRPDHASYTLDDKGILMNSHFAIAAGLNAINEELSQDGRPCIALADSMFESLTYDLMYRQISVAQLLSFFEVVYTLAIGSNVIEQES